MPKVTIPNAGAVGVVMDLAAHELPPAAWTDARNIRFLDGSCPAVLRPWPGVRHAHCRAAARRAAERSGRRYYWLYAGAKKIYAATVTNGSAVHTNLTRQTAGADVDYSGAPNTWTSTCCPASRS
jgi:hypothetical protein